MSKRKDIEYIHKVTGLSYGEARRLYKDSGEDLYKALGLEEALKEVGLIIPDISQAINKLVSDILEVINSINWDKVLEPCNKTLDEINKEELENGESNY